MRVTVCQSGDPRLACHCATLSAEKKNRHLGVDTSWLACTSETWLVLLTAAYLVWCRPRHSILSVHLLVCIALGSCQCVIVTMHLRHLVDSCYMPIQGVPPRVMRLSWHAVVDLCLLGEIAGIACCPMAVHRIVAVLRIVVSIAEMMVSHGGLVPRRPIVRLQQGFHDILFRLLHLPVVVQLSFDTRHIILCHQHLQKDSLAHRSSKQSLLRCQSLMISYCAGCQLIIRLKSCVHKCTVLNASHLPRAS